MPSVANRSALLDGGAAFALSLASGLAFAGAAAATPGARLGAFPPPGWITYLAAGLGVALLFLCTRAPSVGRWALPGALLLAGGLGLTRLGLPGVALGLVLAGPAALAFFLSGPKGGQSSTVGVGLLVGVLALYRFPPTSPSARLWVAIGVLLLLILVVVRIATHREPFRAARGRFDVRAALALSVVVLESLFVAVLFTATAGFFETPQIYGGQGLGRTGSLPGLAFLVAVVVNAVVAGFLGAIRPVLLLVQAVAGLALMSLAPTPLLASAGVLLAAMGLGAGLAPALTRLSRTRAELAPVAIVVSGLLGAGIAAGLVRAFSRPLPGLINVDGVEVAARTDWRLVLGFYALLALVVLLAHLAFVYEFGLAALSPADERDRLPILRHGVHKRPPIS